MPENMKDWKTSLPGLLIVFIGAALPLAKAKWPQYASALDQGGLALTTYAGGHLILGARSGGVQ